VGIFRPERCAAHTDHGSGCGWQVDTIATVDFVFRHGEPEKPSKRKPGKPTYSKTQLEKLIQDATIDCYDEDEQVLGMLPMIGDSLAVPFETEVLGTKVTVESVECIRGREIVAICRAGKHRQAISLADLRLPCPPPEGAEWIAAYRHWVSTF
jgi:hypothetical protein